MKDPQIRQIIRLTELARYSNDPNSKIVEELKLPVAKARIDMAVINGHFHGYEIKSASDTLQRLPNQLEAYTKVFDYLTIVTEVKYHEKLLSIIPEWVRLCVCDEKKGIVEIQAANLNIKKDGFYIAKLLWREELIDVLKEEQIPFRKKDRNWILCEIISNNIEISKLSEIVREKLKVRTNWKIKAAHEAM